MRWQWYFWKGRVASFTDAWIETCVGNGTFGRGGSHLLQMRGLKPFFGASYPDARWSHLLQMRGLKPRSLALTP